jgi:hypothetical protein
MIVLCIYILYVVFLITKDPLWEQLEVWANSYNANIHCDFFNYFWKYGNVLALQEFIFSQDL